MVVVNYPAVDSCFRRNDLDQNNDQRRSLQDEVAAVDDAIANFCPRLRRSVSLLSQHKVGPLQQRVYLSDFKSSSSSLPSIDDLTLNPQIQRYDRFVLAMPYFSEEISETSYPRFMVRWSIIAQCSRPNQAPEVILLGIDDSSIISSRSGDATLHRSQSNQRSHHHLRLQQQSHQLNHERYWQQYVISDAFQLQCLANWNTANNENLFSLQYCLLADQLYECYAHFQLYKLKLLLTSAPTKLQSSPQLIQAYTQYKKLTESALTDINTITTEIKVELLVTIDNGVNIKGNEDRRHQTISSAMAHMRAIISMISNTQAVLTLPKSSKNIDNNEYTKELLHLVSVTTTFPTTSSSISSSHNKNATTSDGTIYNSNSNLNNKYAVKVLNSKLDQTTHQGAMMAMMLDTATKCLDTTMIDFVSYVRQVQHAAIQAYNCEINSSEENKLSPDNIDESVQLLLKSLYEVFCYSSSNGNYLLDYLISNHSITTKNTTSFIRFLLIDDDISTDTSQIKYILTIEYNTQASNENSSSTDKEDMHVMTTKTLVPVVALRSVYDDEDFEHYLDIEVADIINSADDDDVKYSSQLATIIKVAALNGMQQLRHKIATPVLTRYSKQWSPIDPYLASLLS